MSIRLENTTGSHYKFWTLELNGRTIVTTWGRIGSWAQSKTFRFESLASALRYAQRKLESKLGRGYVVA